MNHKNFAQSALAAAITDTAGTAITVTSGATFPAVPFIISIDTEAMSVTGTGAGTNWTVTRGYEGSTAATHLNGAIIYHDISAAEADAIAAKKTDNVSATDKVLGRSTAGAGVIEEIACTAAGRALLDDANAAAQIVTLGLDADLATFVLPASTTITAAAQTILDDATVAAILVTIGGAPLAPAGATYTPATGAQTVTIDVTAGNMHVVTGHASGTAITFAITGATNNQPFVVSILQGGTTVSTITAWFATIRWAGGTAPTLTATLNKRDTFGFIRTGANTYDGFVIGQNA